MKRSFLLIALVALAAGAALGQSPTSGQSQSQSQTTAPRQIGPRPAQPNRKGRAPVPTPKWQIAVGAAFNRYNAPTGYLNMPGWTASGGYTVRRWLGAQAELTGWYANKALVGFTSVHTAMIGPEFFPLGHHRFTPFGHFLFGESYYRDSIPAFGGFPSKVNTDLRFAWEGGLGLETHYKRNWSIRFPQFDYVATRFYTNQPNTPGQSNYRLQLAVVYSIGQK
jgi:hypothetical protein